jgi:hypothetical protein
MQYSVGSISAAVGLVSGKQNTVKKYMEWQTGNVKCSSLHVRSFELKKYYV